MYVLDGPLLWLFYAAEKILLKSIQKKRKRLLHSFYIGQKPVIFWMKKKKRIHISGKSKKKCYSIKK